jgi:hypothetical protein
MRTNEVKTEGPDADEVDFEDAGEQASYEDVDLDAASVCITNSPQLTGVLKTSLVRVRKAQEAQKD